MARSYGRINNIKADVRGSVMHRKWLALIFLMTVVYLQLAACANVKPGYLIQDSGHRALGISGWLDNQTVVFIASNEPKQNLVTAQTGRRLSMRGTTCGIQQRTR